MKEVLYMGNKDLITLIICLFVLCHPHHLVAQQVHFDQVSVAEGLSSNSVYSIFQDSYGVLWLGTLDGLNRYDGHNIIVFKHDNLKKGSLINNRITFIYEDSHHLLWLYDEFSSTMTKYDRANDSFTPYYLEKIAGEGLKTLDSVDEKQDGTLSIRSMDGHILAYNAREDNFDYLGKDPIPVPDWQRNKTWTPLLEDFKKFLSVSRSGFDLTSIGIRKIIMDSERRFWIATKFGGLYSAIYESNGFEFLAHLHVVEKSQRINSEEIFDVFEDRSKVVWIGTKNSGLFRHTRYKYKFDGLEEVRLQSGEFQIGAIRAIVQDTKKNIWIGTNEQGLVRVDANLKTGKLYRPDPGDPNSIGHRFIRSLWVDKRNQLWVGHYHGFSQYQTSLDKFVRYLPKAKTGEEIRVYDFNQGRNGEIWMAGWDLIFKFDPEKNDYQFISRSENPELGFTIENVRDLELDREGDLWLVAGEKGLSIFDKTLLKFKVIEYSPSFPKGIPSNNIFDIYRDSRNQIWLSTADGLCRFEPNTSTGETFTINDGLPSNLIYGIVEDRHGNLWMSTTKGIARFDPRTRTSRNYDVSDGLLSNEFTENAFFQNDEGVIFFGGTNGLNYFHPDKIPDNPYPPQVAITKINVFDKPLSEVELLNETLLKQKVDEHSGITLSPQQRSISFEFIAYHFVNPQKNRYAYMLDGFDQGWTYRDANVRFANYTNLEPGKYSFRLKACNSDGVWSEVIELPIVIEEPFYANRLFIASSALLLASIGVVLYRRRIATVKKQQSMKSIQLESELNFLKSQVNPHFLFNTLNNIYALCQVNSRNAAPMVGKISEMMRYMIYDCTTPMVPLKKEIDYLKNYIDLNQLKSHRKLNASIDIEGNIDHHKIAPLLLINFLENSFKHGDINVKGDGFIQVYIKVLDDQMTFTVRNSFRESMSQEQKQSGIGLENVKHRLALLYPGRHFLLINKNNSIFEVELKLRME